eukprot:4461468-Amphidinium_carterae.1
MSTSWSMHGPMGLWVCWGRVHPLSSGPVGTDIGGYNSAGIPCGARVVRSAGPRPEKLLTVGTGPVP